MRRARPFQSVNLNQLVDEVLEVTRSRWMDAAQAQGVAYDLRVEAAPVSPVAGDPSELREVLTNLLFNALDAMPEGGRITFRTGVHGDEAYCVVTDTGPGMTTEVRQRVFDPFFTTKAEKGTGLGLSVAYGIITRHGGSIEVESEPGQGSVFTIRLPVASEIPAGLAKPPPPRPQHGARVLVIDDEERVRQVLVEMLLGQGHVVTACADARSGLVRFHEEPFDLVFTDLAMPAVSGWEVARLVKQERPGTPVVLVTGWGDQIELGEARAKGADWVVAKPFEIEGVRAAVARALSRPG
jgi:CheY-like chemotaxis protein